MAPAEELHSSLIAQESEPYPISDGLPAGRAISAPAERPHSSMEGPSGYEPSPIYVWSASRHGRPWHLLRVSKQTL